MTPKTKKKIKEKPKIKFKDKSIRSILPLKFLKRQCTKYGLQVDIWMRNQEEAKKFGIQYLKMEIF